MRLFRNSYDKLLKLLDLFPAVAILGVRQCGKTELSKELLAKNWKYFDLEKADDFDRISRDPGFFFSQYPSKVILDEAQTYPELFNELRSVIDHDRKEKGRFLLTGSSSPELIKSISESLAGRIAIIELGTLKMNELYNDELSNFFNIFEGKLNKNLMPNLDRQFSKEQINNCWFYGGYPEPMLSSKNTAWEMWMQAYFDTYINRDLQLQFPKLDKTRFRRFIYMLAHISGNQLVKNDLAKSIEVSESSIKDYIEIADGTFVWRNLTSFEHQIKKQVYKMPRGHLRDSGLLHFLLKFKNIDDLEGHPILGRSFENFVIEEILKGLQASMVSGWSAHYYRTRAKSEIDLILHGPFGILPIEIKYGRKVRKENYKTLGTFVKEHNLEFGILINNSEKVEWLSNEIIQIPVGCL